MLSGMSGLFLSLEGMLSCEICNEVMCDNGGSLLKFMDAMNHPLQGCNEPPVASVLRVSENCGMIDHH